MPDRLNASELCTRSVSLLDIYPTLVEACDLPEVDGLEGTSLMPQLKDPKAKRRQPAITTWHYQNHAARSQNFRYIRYRDGSEELYDHRSDPDEHHNIANNPKLASIKKKLASYFPKKNVVPKSIEDGGTDSYGKKQKRLLEEGVPKWLGKVPSEFQGK